MTGTAFAMGAANMIKTSDVFEVELGFDTNLSTTSIPEVPGLLEVNEDGYVKI